MTKEVIGIAGCGAMGEPMVQRLLAAGFEVWAHDVRPLAEFGVLSLSICWRMPQSSRGDVMW